MTLIRLHGILAKEYGNTFCFAVGNPRNVLEAIDCNRSGFKSRLIELHQEGFSYDIIIDTGFGEGFCMGNIIKYAKRYGRKAGKNRDDLMKILHYGIIMLHINDTESEDEVK